MKLNFRIWRQSLAEPEGRFENYALSELAPESSLLEALDGLNEQLAERGARPIAFDSDCREGICGACGFLIDGVPHGPQAGMTTCEVRLRSFADGAELTLEPFRAAAFPLLADLMVDRAAFDHLIQAGGFVGTRTGSAPEAGSIPVAKQDAESALDAAACIGCGACVAACPNGSASLFVAAKLAHLNALPQGRVERHLRVLSMVDAADSLGFGPCSQHGECAAACPKQIPLTVIAKMNRALLRAAVSGQRVARAIRRA